MKTTQLNTPPPVPDGTAPEGNQAVAIYQDYHSRGEKIRPEDLERFGYRLTARHIVISGGYKLYELLSVNSSNNATQSFLAPSHRLPGVIIPMTFNEHKAAASPLTARARHAASGIGNRRSRAASGLCE